MCDIITVCCEKTWGQIHVQRNTYTYLLKIQHYYYIHSTLHNNHIVIYSNVDNCRIKEVNKGQPSWVKILTWCVWWNFCQRPEILSFFRCARNKIWTPWIFTFWTKERFPSRYPNSCDLTFSNKVDEGRRKLLRKWKKRKNDP